MTKYRKSDIRSISDLATADGGRRLTPVFKGDSRPIFVKITKSEWQKVKGDSDAMKDLVISKLNNDADSKVKTESKLESYIRKIVKEERQKLREAKIYNSFKDKYGNEYKFDNYLDFAKFWFNSPQKFLKSQFPDNFAALQRYATNSKEARSKYVK